MYYFEVIIMKMKRLGGHPELCNNSIGDESVATVNPQYILFQSALALKGSTPFFNKLWPISGIKLRNPAQHPFY